MIQRSKLQAIVVLGLLSAVLVPASVLAWPGQDKTTVTGPGFKYESKQGWFGTQEKTYTDAMGNTYKQKKGLFGREKVDQNFFGAKATVRNGHTKVLGPDGRAVVEQKQGLFGGKETTVDANKFIHGIQNAIQNTVNPVPVSP